MDLSDINLEEEANKLLGRAPADASHPWLTPAEYRYRVYPELPLKEAVLPDPRDHYSTIELEVDLQEIIYSSGLTVEERRCVTLSQVYDPKEVAEITGLKYKTVLRRTASAMRKMVEHVKSVSQEGIVSGK